jgi:hypothetical protein
MLHDRALALTQGSVTEAPIARLIVIFGASYTASTA